MQTAAAPLNEAQLEVLKIFSTGITESELQELKQLLLEFKFRRVTQMADAIWQEKGLTSVDTQRQAKRHLRTPYRSFQAKKQRETPAS